jgi:hypothetical protein
VGSFDADDTNVPIRIITAQTNKCATGHVFDLFENSPRELLSLAPRNQLQHDNSAPISHSETTDHPMPERRNLVGAADAGDC